MIEERSFLFDVSRLDEQKWKGWTLHSFVQKYVDEYHMIIHVEIDDPDGRISCFIVVVAATQPLVF